MPERASLILINDHGEVLLIERVKGDRHYWVFPGGSVEDGESLSEAAKREALEETSIELKSLTPVFQIQNQGRMEYYFLSHIGSATPVLGYGPEQQRRSASNQYILRWVSFTELAMLPLFPVEAKQICLQSEEVLCGR
ncbi:NUDIX hydrolase [Vibrio campbellii]|uniref:NUDIX hydrolase n=1 Tax=Vibrio campbellii TaxID=680 RepID=UPI00068203EC|nr:NUDIX domain-containing protein [Vibrio campbellii]OPH50190.1 DNA mismatch repair protein MutT [Vibrio campbellii]HDM8237127.1 NUDIX domain-containing protein [Vibrio campbellii]